MKHAFGVLVSLLLAAGCGGDDDPSPQEALRDDLEALEDAFNDGDARRIYEDFMALDCRDRLSPEEAEERFEAQASEAGLQIDEPLQVTFAEEEATVRVAMAARAEGEERTAVDSFGMVFEDGHWRFSDCFGAVEEDVGGLG